MTLVVCALADVDAQIARWRPARLVSLLAPDQVAPTAPSGAPHLVLRLHDIADAEPGLVAPSRDLVADLLAFGAAWREPAPLLVHCWMGISRSTAAALSLACAVDAARSEMEIAQALRAASPTATPNPRIIAEADHLLGRSGRLVAAAAAIGRGAPAMAGTPFSLQARPAPSDQA